MNFVLNFFVIIKNSSENSYYVFGKQIVDLGHALNCNNNVTKGQSWLEQTIRRFI